MIRIEENKISVNDFNYLNDKVGWGTRDGKAVEEALNNTLYSVSIYDDNKIIGYGRFINIFNATRINDPRISKQLAGFN